MYDLWYVSLEIEKITQRIKFIIKINVVNNCPLGVSLCFYNHFFSKKKCKKALVKSTGHIKKTWQLSLKICEKKGGGKVFFYFLSSSSEEFGVVEGVSTTVVVRPSPPPWWVARDMAAPTTTLGGLDLAATLLHHHGRQGPALATLSTTMDGQDLAALLPR